MASVGILEPSITHYFQNCLSEFSSNEFSKIYCETTTHSWLAWSAAPGAPFPVCEHELISIITNLNKIPFLSNIKSVRGKPSTIDSHLKSFWTVPKIAECAMASLVWCHKKKMVASWVQPACQKNTTVGHNATTQPKTAIEYITFWHDTIIRRIKPVSCASCSRITFHVGQMWCQSKIPAWFQLAAIRI